MYLVIIEWELSPRMSHGTHPSIYGNNMPRWPIYKYGTQYNGKDWGKDTQCIIVRGIMCKNTHSSNNACSYDKMNNTIVFLIIFYGTDWFNSKQIWLYSLRSGIEPGISQRQPWVRYHWATLLIVLETRTGESRNKVQR